MSRRRLVLFCVVLFSAATTGCRREAELFPATGQLLDGEAAMADVLVTFVPDGSTPARPSRGTTDAGGTFELRYEDGRLGVVAGPHRVLLEDLRPFQAPRNDKPTTARPPASRLPGELASAERTPLRHEFDPQAGPIVLRVPRPLPTSR